MLFVGVDDPKRGGSLCHVANATEALLELVVFTAQHQQLFLGEARLRAVFEVHGVKLFHALQALVDGVEVCQQTSQPALVDVGLADAHCLLDDYLLGLLLGANKHDRTTVGNQVTDVVVCLIDVLNRLL